MAETVANLRDYFEFYNQERPHQALGYETPAAVYFGRQGAGRGGEKRGMVRAGR